MKAIAALRLAPLPESRPCSLPLRFGIPFGRGDTGPSSLKDIAIEDARGNRLPSWLVPLSRWSDGSVRWALATVGLPPETPADAPLRLGWAQPAESAAGQPALEFDDASQMLTRPDGSSVGFAETELGPVAEIRAGAASDPADFSVITRVNDPDGRAAVFRPGRFRHERAENPLLQAVAWNGSAYLDVGGSMRELQIEIRFVVFALSELVQVTMRVHNPQAARHRDGRWDLGDPGSIRLGAFALEIRPRSRFDRFELQCEADGRYASMGGSWTLFQASSGGANWRSPVHVQADCLVDLPFQGYRVEQQGARIDEGARSDPIVQAAAGDSALSLHVDEFWQNFPAAVCATAEGLAVEFLAARTRTGTELQGGEQKTSSLSIDFSGRQGALDWCRSPVLPTVDAGYLAGTGAAPLLSLEPLEAELERIVRGGVDGADSFFEKREAIDEYGWRHYGELYADHETLNYRGELPLVSHYNNQYDPVESFWRQAVRSGDQRWLQLARALANHVVDIDIYRTDRDRPEYNGGLFWHTDHYVHARTATHRTYSRLNDTSCDGEVGGGPAAEHCYTSGLASMFFLTGDERYRNAALGLTDWIHRLHRPGPGLLAWLERSLRVEVRTLAAVLRGRSAARFRYPLTRGTGNYLNALIDAYLLTGDAKYIDDAYAAIRLTLHPGEDVAERDLLDAELRWSYLVMLQSVCRFVAVCEADGLAPEAVEYAGACVCRFAEWMAEHEQPFLARAEFLDYPNETWVAQDLRKAWILRAAASLYPDKREVFLRVADEFVEAVSSGLRTSRNAVHTRIIILLLQNRPEDASLLRSPEESGSEANISSATAFGEVPVWRLAALAREILAGFLVAIRQPSPRREYDWLRFRFRDRLPRFRDRHPGP